MDGESPLPGPLLIPGGPRVPAHCKTLDGRFSRARVFVLAVSSGLRVLGENSQIPPIRVFFYWNRFFCSRLAALFLFASAARAAEETQPSGLPTLSPAAKVS